MKLISPAEMQECEKKYFEKSGVKSISMMEEAAEALADAVQQFYPDARRIFIACGPGGNGGDGYACARLLQEIGLECTIFAPLPPRSPDAIENARRARECGIEIQERTLPDEDDEPDLWIDCIFGTGFARSPDALTSKLIDIINDHHGPQTGVISADIPSGLNGQTGKKDFYCVKADHTIAFGFAKYGCFLQDGLDCCGEVHVNHLSFPSEAFPDKLPEIIRFERFPRLLLPQRRRSSHKNQFGHLLIIAGSVGMAGAAALCARAALRSGVGLVTIACPEEIVPILQMQAPCAMCLPLPRVNGVIGSDAVPILERALYGKDAIAIGPGLGTRVSPKILRTVLECGRPAVIDADALNLLAMHPDLMSLLNKKHILTPHPGEARRLLVGRYQDDPIADAQLLAERGNAVILKGASRVIVCSDSTGTRTIVSTAGCCGMARGGSGDVFTGLLGGMLAWKEYVGAGLLHMACEIHGMAGELAQEKYGSYGMNAGDIIEFLPEVFKFHVD